MVPHNFCQLYVVLAKVVVSYVPLLYCLLPNKCKSTYIRLFSVIKTLVNTCYLQRIIIDFESAVASAIKEVFECVKINYCLFHMGQIFYRLLQSSGLSSHYNNDFNIKIDLKMILSLAFVEESCIINYFNAIKQYLKAKYINSDINKTL
jgi:hypothetical protein